ncbi:MAG: oligosaccharide flippase family protein [Gammaproteobacteria bacterium]|nr:oligosaccharide flippase family protein [Gammaproteobacteria bacterium]
MEKNILANLVGSASTAFLSFAFVPFYIHFMGIESFGLVGFFITMQAVFLLLDMGLSATVSRELARLSVMPGSEQEMRNSVRTLELVYAALAAVVVTVVIGVAPWISEKWLDASQMPPETIHQSIVLMAIVIAVRLPTGLYYGGLQGLQRQILLNSVRVLIGVVQSGGVVLVLWLVSPTVEAFFIWQAIAAGLGVILLAWSMWHCLPGGERARFQIDWFRNVWRFAASMSLISAASVILLQTDKIILSKMLTLENFAYYALASSVAMGLYNVISPVFAALYPRFTQLVTSEADVEVRDLFHKSCQLMTVLTMPLALVIAAFSESALQIWTHNGVLAGHSAPILSLLIIGTAMNGMMNVPYALVLAHGWTKLSLYSSIISVLLLVPMLFILVPRYGAVGAATAWLILNAGYIVINAPIIHGKFLNGEFKEWFFHDVGIPSLAAVSMVAIFVITMPDEWGYLGQLTWIILAFLASLVCSILMAPAIRRHVQRILF